MSDDTVTTAGVYKCGNVGCRYSDKYCEQIRRYKKKCNLPLSFVAMSIRLEDGTYQCQTCSRKFSQQSNISCHIKNNTCKTFKVTKIQNCDVCLKTLSTKVHLKDIKKIMKKTRKYEQKQHS